MKISLQCCNEYLNLGARQMKIFSGLAADLHVHMITNTDSPGVGRNKVNENRCEFQTGVIKLSIAFHALITSASLKEIDPQATKRLKKETYWGISWREEYQKLIGVLYTYLRHIWHFKWRILDYLWIRLPNWMSASKQYLPTINNKKWSPYSRMHGKYAASNNLRNETESSFGLTSAYFWLMCDENIPVWGPAVIQWKYHEFSRVEIKCRTDHFYLRWWGRG